MKSSLLSLTVRPAITCARRTGSSSEGRLTGVLETTSPAGGDELLDRRDVGRVAVDQRFAVLDA